MTRQRNAGGARTHQAFIAGAGVRIAGVDHHGTYALTRRQVFTAHLHRRGAKPVAGEHPSYRRALVDQHDRQVLAVGLAHTGFGDANAHPGHRVQMGIVRSSQIHSHFHYLVIEMFRTRATVEPALPGHW